MVKIMRVLSPNELCLCFAILSVEMPGFRALMQMLKLLQCVKFNVQVCNAV